MQEIVIPSGPLSTKYGGIEPIRIVARDGIVPQHLDRTRLGIEPYHVLGYSRLAPPGGSSASLGLGGGTGRRFILHCVGPGYPCTEEGGSSGQLF